MVLENMPKFKAVKVPGETAPEDYITLDNYRAAGVLIADNDAKLTVKIKAKKGEGGGAVNVPFLYKLVSDAEYDAAGADGLELEPNSGAAIVAVTADSLARGEYDRVSFGITAGSGGAIGTLYTFRTQPR
jgi:hypothetical protein